MSSNAKVEQVGLRGRVQGSAEGVERWVEEVKRCKVSVPPPTGKPPQPGKPPNPTVSNYKTIENSVKI